jgi:glycosyltransferase involved in cell wall biosynthesis
VPGIGEDDKVLIWGGGIYNWFDPVTLIDAMGLLAETHPEIKLFFLSSRHFDAQVPEMEVLATTVARADALGLTGRTVFFNETWVDYDDRVNFLMDADIGVSTHVPHVETRFSFRTRLLDYIWAGLPIISTEGDVFAEVIRDRGLGRVVPPRDAQALVEAILEVLYDPEVASNARAATSLVREGYAWPQAMAPLLDFCREPRRSADSASAVRQAGDRFSRILSMPKGLRRDIALARYYATSGGWGLVKERVVGRRRRLDGER